MKFMSNSKGQPLLQFKGKIYNLNSKKEINEKCFRIKPGMARIASIKDRNILYNAGKYFKVTRLAFSQNVKYYMFDNHLKLFCIIKDDETQVVGNYPIHYLKLICRFMAEGPL